MENNLKEKIMEKEEQTTKDRLQKLVEKMGKLGYLGYNDHMIRRLKKLVSELQQNGVYGLDKFVQKLLYRVNDKEAYLDILMEGRFAIILVRLKFSKIQIEYCEKGPDIIANWNRNTVYFEVTRRHSEVDEWAEQPEAAFVMGGESDENIIGRIQEKLKQLQSGQTNIIVIWSDTKYYLLSDFEKAFEDIKQENEQNPGTYNDLSAILFTEGEESYRITLKKFYLFKNVTASKPLGIRLTRKLESLHKQNLKKIEGESEKLATAMKQL